MRQIARLLVFSVALGCVTALPGGAQPSPRPQATPDLSQNQPGQRPRRDPDDPMVKIEKEQQKRLNKERQEELKKDTDRLLELATELKTSVDKSNEHTLSLDVVRKAEEIEKLAKRVREKMKGS